MSRLGDFKAVTGVAGPKVAQETGAASGIVGAPAGDYADELYKKRDETMRKQQGYKKGGKVSSASNRADGCVAKGKTRGKMI
jgi:hypothetical protein